MTTRLPSKSRPVLSVTRTTTVLDAARTMVEAKVGAVAILEGEKLLGIFTERDALARVLIAGRDPSKTTVGDVMTTELVTVQDDADRSTALRLMNEKHIRHLPVLDREGRVRTMLSMRHLLRAEVNDLQQTVWELVAETAIDGAGG